MRFQNLFGVIFTVLIAMMGYAVYAVLVPVSIPSGQVFVVEKGEGLSVIADHLAKEGHIRSRSVFAFYAFFSGSAKKLQAGRYDLSGEMKAGEILRKLRQGDVIAPDRSFIIIEGWDIDDIADYFKKEGLIEARQEALEIMYDSGRWAALVNQKHAFLLEELKNKKSLEGFLFPDTYRIEFSEKPEVILSLLLNSFAEKISPYRDEIEKQGKTLFQVVTMASLIEKEVAAKDDRKIVSGILWKRFLAGYPLQVDATIIYLTGKNTIKIPTEDLWIESPYNTYRNTGLPPGPISNPGIDAIEAALHPEKSPYWFYLSAPDGTTIFSKTFDEHKKAKAKYLQ